MEEDDSNEIGELFQEAYRVLTTAKCRITAMATFNRAMTMLHELEKSSDPEIARAAKEAHGMAKQMIGKDRSLHKTLQVYAHLWSGNA